MNNSNNSNINNSIWNNNYNSNINDNISNNNYNSNINDSISNNNISNINDSISNNNISNINDSISPKNNNTNDTDKNNIHNNNINNTNDDNNSSNIDNQSDNSLQEAPLASSYQNPISNDNKIDKPKIDIQNTNKTLSFLENNNVIAVQFNSGDNRINRAMACYKESFFKQIEQKLYTEYPGIKDDISCFLVNGKPINRETTFEENQIKDGDSIIICFKNYDTPEN